jgi:hypothetical protein
MKIKDYFNSILYAIPILMVCCVLSSCSSESVNNSIPIIISNTSYNELIDYPISIKREELNIKAIGKYPFLTKDSGDTISVQLDDLDGDGQWDEMFFVINLAPSQDQKLNLKWIDDELKYKLRTQVRFGVRESLTSTVQPALSSVFYPHQLPGVMGYQPYQTDGPSWENDKVGFRHYLDGRNSKDVFGKKVSEMSPLNVGISADGVTEDNYHVMEDWGRDILSVGNSVGIGGISLLIGDQLARLGVTEQDSLNNVDSTYFKIITTGPARSIMTFKYHHWRPLPFKRDYEVQEVTSIWPGIYGYKNKVMLSGLNGDESLVIGLVNSRTENPLKELLINENWVVLYTHDLQTYEKEWYLGLALILPTKAYKGFMEAPKTGKLSNTFLAKINIENNQPIEYYALACWELQDEGFRDLSYFQNYILKTVAQLDAKVNVVFSNKIK